MTVSAPVAHQRARIAALSRDRAPDDPDLLDAYSLLRAIRLAEQVRKTAPLLTPQQRGDIARMLLPEDAE